MLGRFVRTAAVYAALTTPGITEDGRSAAERLAVIYEKQAIVEKYETAIMQSDVAELQGAKEFAKAVPADKELMLRIDELIVQYQQLEQIRAKVAPYRRGCQELEPAASIECITVYLDVRKTISKRLDALNQRHNALAIQALGHYWLTRYPRFQTRRIAF